MVFFPLKRLRYNRKGNTLTVILILTVFALLAYSHVFFTSGFEKNGGAEQVCVTLDEWFHFVKVSLLVDSLLSIVIPFILIATINLAIASKLVKFSNVINVSLQRDSTITITTNTDVHSRSFKGGNLPLLKNGNKRAESSIQMNELNNGLTGSNINDLALTSILDGTLKEKRLKRYFKSTRMLFAISITFLVLNSPLALCKIRYSLQAIESYFQSKQVSSSKPKPAGLINEAHPFEEIIERVTCYLYYLNFTLNFGFYILSGSQFNLKIYLARIWSTIQYKRHP